MWSRRARLALGATATMAISACQTGGMASSSVVRRGDILEVNVTNTPDRTNGQPVVAVNPRNPDNIVFVSTAHVTSGATLNRLACFAAHSEDGGQSWSQAAWPYGDRPLCGDPYLAVDSSGTFFIAYNRLGCPGAADAPLNAPCAAGPGNVGVARSTDGGRTWSVPVDTPGARSVTPRLRVDVATGYVYAVGGLGIGKDPIMLSVSEDHGVSWSARPALPQQAFGNQIAVHAGVLATATTLKVVDGTRIEPDAVNFWVSMDEGRTFTSFPVTDSAGAAIAPPAGHMVPNGRTTQAPGEDLAVTDPIPLVSADPTRRGRFALMIPRGDNLEIYITADSGHRWTGPTVVAAPHATRPWMEFGSGGRLGVMWRGFVKNAVDAYATVSVDGGRTFGQPLKVNQQTQPYNYAGAGGDEWSRIMLDDKYAYVTWSDGRGGGNIDGIFARVPLSRFR
jgi:hypothetical protein